MPLAANDMLDPAERFDGTPFTDRGVENIPGVSELLSELLAVA